MHLSDPAVMNKGESMHVSLRSTRASRIIVAGAATVGISLLGATPTVEAVAAPASGHPASPCATENAEARVMAGMAGQDPNSLSPAQVTAREKVLQRAAQKARRAGRLTAARNDDTIEVTTYV